MVRGMQETSEAAQTCRAAEHRYLTKAQAQTYTGLSERTLDYARERGELPFFRVGKRVLFKRSEIDAWLEKHRVGVDLDAIVDDVVSSLGVTK